MTASYSELRGRAVLVTGGGQGIGEAIIRAFVRQGAKVAFLDIAEAASEALAAELSERGATVVFQHCDLTDIPALRASIEKLAGEVGPFQVLINNAGDDERHATEEVTESYWDQRVAVNLKHQFFAAQAVLPAMRAAGAGCIVNLGSTSWLAGQGGMAAYTACKSAVIGLTRSLARDYGPHGVRVNAVAPGWIMTPRQLERWVSPETIAELHQRQCLQRMLQPSEVAEFVVFLSSDSASACTAQHYVVDGGWT